ncbi:MAG: hypothetical protein ACLRWM_15890 [Streptococcus sp.]
MPDNQKKDGKGNAGSRRPSSTKDGRNKINTGGSRERAVPHSSGLRNYIKEETLAIHRDRGTNGNEIGENITIIKENPDMVFTSLGHLINQEMLKSCHTQMDGTKAEYTLGSDPIKDY